MASCHKSALMSPAVFAIVNYVAWYLSIPLGDRCIEAYALEGLVFLELTDFQFFRVLPLGIPVLLVDEHSFLMITGHLVSILVDWAPSIVLQTSLVNHATKLLHVLEVPLATSPSRLVQQVVLLCIHRHGDGIVSVS